MTTRLKIPAHLGMTSRQWKTRKRRELKALILALGDLQVGVAYTPIYQHGFDVVQKTLDDWRRMLSAKEWGR